MSRRCLSWIFGVALGLAGHGQPAQGYSVASAVSDPCHEKMTGEAAKTLLSERSFASSALPENTTWKKVSRYLMESAGMEPSSFEDRERFWLASLLIGSRAPDTDGHSVLNLENLHRLHSDPSAYGQYAHSLRAPDDDGAEGDAAAVTGTRLLIQDLLEKSITSAKLGDDEQFIDADFYLEFYGRVSLKVSAPFYYLGRAAHALQDSFSHTIRDEQEHFTRVVHVLNYIDAISSDFDETRDGLAHSDQLDACMKNDLAPLFDASVEATKDLLEAAMARDDPADKVEQALDAWLVLKPGCSLENDFCDNGHWLKIARIKQTGPYLQEIFACKTVRGGAGQEGVFWFLVGLFAVVLGRYRNARFQGE